MTCSHGNPYLVLILFTLTAAAPLGAVVQPEETPLRAKIYRHESLAIDSRQLPPGEVQADALSALGVDPQAAYLDALTGRWATLMPSQPLLPGKGVGNELTWEEDSVGAAQPPDGKAYGQLAWGAFARYLRRHQQVLGIDVAELPNPGKVTVHQGGDLVQIYGPRQVDGIAVRDSYVTAVLRHGNLVLLGSRNWGDVTVSRQPQISTDQAFATVRSHIAPVAVAASFRKTHLTLVPVTAEESLAYRLAWVVHPVIKDDLGTWEALVDAANGELLAFEDRNSYATARFVKGGVLPETNDGGGPEGTEQPDWPMPFADVSNAGDILFTDAGGNLLSCVDGDITTALSGQYMNMVDNCGAMNETTADDVLDLGVSAGTDCSIPAGASAGNTHASRSGFYGMNRIKEQARAELPSNSWLDQQLTSNVNINGTCNAFWNGSTVNFYRSGGGCANTGELAGVYAHEWGHGMDNNDALPAISNPGEGIADVYAYLRLNTSCIGRGFNLGSACNGYGDPCVGSPPCDGVRDIDWANRASGVPHDLDWLVANCPTGGGPCGGASHCEGAAYAEAIYDLVNRDLPAEFSIDSNTARAIGTRLTYLGGGAVGNWFTCSPPYGGCNADGGYLNFLAAADDDGDLTNGTPYMQAIFDAFNRHQIACDTPAVAPGPCTPAPPTAPVVSGTRLDRGVRLTWGPVADTSRYVIYRHDGPGCFRGATTAGYTTDLSFEDTGLTNGREYSYTVNPLGLTGVCFGPASPCLAITPTAGHNLAIPLEPVPGSLSFVTGDGDAFLDNCEQLQVGVEVSNIGTETQTNVRIVSVEGVDNSDIFAVSALPAPVDANMTPCEVNEGTVTIQAGGLSLNDPVAIRVGVTSDELAPLVRSQIVAINLPTEGDFQSFDSRTFNFENDLETWQLVQGTFTRTGDGGGDGTTFSVDSSSLLDNACDRIRSPVISLSSVSTLSLWSNYDIEPPTAGTWYDRANVSIIEADGTRTVVNPDGGRLYDADSSGPGTYNGCNEPEEGWAGLNDTWGTSSWSAAALGSEVFTGDLVQLEVGYGTDGGTANRGFWFDEVTLTNFDLQVADNQPDVCPVGPIFADSFESGNTSAWSATVP